MNWRVRCLALLLCLAGAAAYYNSVGNPFVFDDDESIVTNASIHRLDADALSAPRESPTAGRPVVNVSLAMNYAAGGLSPIGYRVTNVAIHILAALVLFGLVRRALGQSADAQRAAWIAFAAALLWLVHPLQTETIDYITQRTESLAGLFVLLTVYCAARGIQQEAPMWYAAAVGASALGMASKESAVVAPVLVLLYDAAFEARSVGAALKKRAALYGGLAATWVVLAALALPGPRARTAGFSAGVTPWTYLLNQSVMIAKYLRLAVWPDALVLDYGPTRPISLALAAPFAALMLLLLGASVAAWRKQRRGIGFLGAWFFLTLAPSSSIVPIASEVGAERRMYLPLAAVIVLVVAGLSRAWNARRAQFAALAIVAIVLTALTVRRNHEYESRIALWQTVLDRAPQGRVHFNLGAELAAQGRHDDAIREYRLGLPDSFEAQLGLGYELHARGEEQEAVEHLREYIRRQPNGADAAPAYNAMGRALVPLGRMDEAIDAFRHVIELQPQNGDVRRILSDQLVKKGNAASLAGDSAAALAAFREAVRFNARNSGAETNLGATLHALGNLDEARAHYLRAIAIDPNNADAHNDLGHLWAGAGRYQDAIDEYRQALARRPGWPVAMTALASAQASLAADHGPAAARPPAKARVP